MENLSEQTDAEKAGNAVKQTVKTNIGQIAEIGENAENAEETAQATERAEFGLDGLVADVNIPRGTVVLAATPIGNTGDASARLIALMEGADIVAAEDTRRLYALANRLGIRVPGRVIAYHDHNERDKADGLLDQVEQGATVLVVSDAGMPTINDPGLAIVRRAIERGLPVTCAPGPSAVLDALCLSGLPTDRFCYEGFLPRKHSERVQHLRALKSERRTIVFYETLHRIDESMADLLDVLGPNRKMALCRELTKDYEQIRRGTIAEIRQSVVDDPPRGEWCSSSPALPRRRPTLPRLQRCPSRIWRCCQSTARRKTTCVSRTRFHRLSPNIRCLTARSPIASRSTMPCLR